MATKFCLVKGLANGHFPPNVVNFDSRVRQCHAATCISPSLMHSFYISPICTQPSPRGRICTKFGTGVGLLDVDVITFGNFSAISEGTPILWRSKMDPCHWESQWLCWHNCAAEFDVMMRTCNAVGLSSLLHALISGTCSCHNYTAYWSV